MSRVDYKNNNKNIFFKKILFFSFCFILFLSILFVNYKSGYANDGVTYVEGVTGGIGKSLESVNKNILANIVLVLSSVAFIFFLYNLVLFILHRSQEKADLAKDKENMAWSLIALFLFVSVWGIVAFIQSAAGIENKTNIQIPKLCVNGKCDLANSSNSSTGGGGTSNQPFVNVCATTEPTNTDTEKLLEIARYNTSIKKNLTTNDKSEVKKIQIFLSLNGYKGDYTIIINCEYDAATEAGVKKFQKEKNLMVDGIVGQNTAKKINEEIAGEEQEILDDTEQEKFVPPPPPNKVDTPADTQSEEAEDDTDSTILVSYKQTNSKILEVQRALNTLGYKVQTSGPGSPGKEDDYFGIGTKGALERFVAKNFNITVNWTVPEIKGEALTQRMYDLLLSALRLKQNKDSITCGSGDNCTDGS